ncbi:unnamed protein product [Penicillium salamii]|nr:unnamed protein product [Penicillium salamii]CAG8377583.1 unnamed protein product [Penicillium salamii]
MIGDVLHKRYQIVDKLGYRGYSTVWLAHDTNSKRYVAVKVGIADTPSQETTNLRAIAQRHGSFDEHPGRDAIPLPLDEFEISGPNGTHQCYTMSPAQCNLREVSFSRLFPLEVTRALCYCLTLAIAYTHLQGYAHGDVHLGNILVKLPSSLDQLSIEQFYETYDEPETWEITRRDGKPLSPNVPAKAPPDHPRRVFNRKRPSRSQLTFGVWVRVKVIFSSEWYSADEVTCQQIDILGPVPQNWWGQWSERGQFFDLNGRPKDGRYVWPPMEQAFEEDIQQYRRKGHVGEYGKEETAAILNLMRRMFAYLPEDRPTAEEVLKSEWMVKWCLPEYEKSLHPRE